MRVLSVLLALSLISTSALAQGVPSEPSPPSMPVSPGMDAPSGVMPPNFPQAVDGMVPPPLPEEALLPESGYGAPDIEVPEGMSPEQVILKQVSEEMRLEIERLEKLDKGLPSLFFNKAEQAQLAQAIADYEAGKFDENLPPGLSQMAGLPPGASSKLSVFNFARELVLGGIVFGKDGEWSVWLNRQRLTPGRLPPEVREIHVYKDYVDLKWYDEQNNKVVPVRLRPNQRYNLDSRTFVPG